MLLFQLNFSSIPWSFMQIITAYYQNAAGIKKNNDIIFL